MQGRPHMSAETRHLQSEAEAKLAVRPPKLNSPCSNKPLASAGHFTAAGLCA